MSRVEEFEKTLRNDAGINLESMEIDYVKLSGRGGSFLIIPVDQGTVFSREQFTEEHKMFQQTAREFGINRILPVRDELNVLNKNDPQKLLKAILIKLKNEPNCDGNKFKNISMDVGEKYNLKGKDLFHPLRIALYGSPDGPDIPIIYSILEKNEIINRLSRVINE